MGSENIKLEIAKQAEEIKLKYSTGKLTIEAAIMQAKRNLNRLNGLHQIIKYMEGEDND